MKLGGRGYNRIVIADVTTVRNHVMQSSQGDAKRRWKKSGTVVDTFEKGQGIDEEKTKRW